MRSFGILAAGICLFALQGLVLAQDQKPQKPKEVAEPSDVDRFFTRYDKNKDGVIDRSECPEAFRKFFDRVDVNRDGKLTREELKRVEDKLVRFLDGAPKSRPGGRPGEIITPAARGERLADKLKVGDPAPDFTLPFLKGKGEVTLSSFQGKKPVVLIFASYT